MNRIHQLDPAQATGKTEQLFSAINAKVGFVPNMMRVLGNSPAALQGYLGLSSALTGGALPAKLREQIALAVAEINGCDYCTSAHTVYANKAGLSQNDILGARRSTATSNKSDAALKLARAITLQRGQIADAELQAARSAGLSDEEIVEVIAHVALSVLTNYTNIIARTLLDFPAVNSGESESAAALSSAGV
jgi:uncharacterized peroxidase-related enzyme